LVIYEALSIGEMNDFKKMVELRLKRVESMNQRQLNFMMNSMKLQISFLLCVVLSCSSKSIRNNSEMDATPKTQGRFFFWVKFKDIFSQKCDLKVLFFQRILKIIWIILIPRRKAMKTWKTKRVRKTYFKEMHFLNYVSFSFIQYFYFDLRNVRKSKKFNGKNNKNFCIKKTKQLFFVPGY
jgi:hypothetical protein